MVQSFWQRTHNYLQAWLVRFVVMRLSRSYITDFTAKTGQHIRSHEQGRTAASAVMASLDWALEYPFPLPPKVQVSFCFPKKTLNSELHAATIL